MKQGEIYYKAGKKGLSSPKQVKYEITDTNKDILFVAKNKRIKQLEDKNKKLKKKQN
ncbi:MULTISPECIES: hypothetical protein [Bacillus cereus group]|uniref:hypothetical protein n=1 Tax=Bacillus cereus group TaxID=86661 RepID=UPI000B2656DE|nr:MULTISPECIES: hypothetical protein [Bacillus cereus group]WCA21725.1 hypothetical protein PGS39_28805 [Bacillus paranthracis]